MRLDAGYHGTLELSCSNGLLSASHSCHQLCLTSSSVTVAVGGQTYQASPTESIEHMQTGVVQCGSFAAGFTGDIVLTCHEGTITADVSGCMAPCAAGAAASVSFAGAQHAVELAAQVLHGGTGGVSCSTADSGFTGSLELSCSDGVLSQSSQSCTERACEEGLGYQLQLAGETSSRALAAEVAHAGTVTATCASVAPAWDNEITVTCIKGGLSADYSACKQACLTTDSGDVSLGPNTHSVSPASRMADGDSATKQCLDLGVEHVGTMTD
ncbi:unnamed protein product [Effrenium voratum]|nr:unnamed protein product [Effrenium voratum]